MQDVIDGLRAALGKVVVGDPRLDMLDRAIRIRQAIEGLHVHDVALRLDALAELGGRQSAFLQQEREAGIGCSHRRRLLWDACHA